ncbi:hypothetical protein Catovirus_1_386 [Catovirus CTV1]|mgnify:CR=1|uniref:Uncharacterized protein n=1 Tax=Catovirus CTV1 TaxID=1977631 RepID=A0A1V0S9E1_9VIRU|nr:hypothetical protein Catovirus_1_386 [Catovirus CTV1]
MSFNPQQYLENNSVPIKGVELLKHIFRDNSNGFYIQSTLKIYSNDQMDDKKIAIIDYLFDQMEKHIDWIEDTKADFSDFFQEGIRLWREKKSDYLFHKTIKFIKENNLTNLLECRAQLKHHKYLIEGDVDNWIVWMYNNNSSCIGNTDFDKDIVAMYNHIQYQKELNIKLNNKKKYEQFEKKLKYLND